MSIRKLPAAALAALAMSVSGGILFPPRDAVAERQIEALGRGLVAIRTADDGTSLQWRLLASDPADVAFNVYRVTGDGRPVKVNEAPIDGPTHIVDRDADDALQNAWFVRPVVGGRELDASERFVVSIGAPAQPYLSIPISPPDGYHANDASVGDLDGDGEYEIVVHLVGQGRDNSIDGITTEPIFDAYRMDGTRLWRINLGKNIREGAHYTPFLVYDLDGDGRAEFACRTSDGTQDARGNIIGDGDADHRNAQGHVITGPEFVTVFDGLSGAALASANYLPSRGDVAGWGDSEGNRSERFLACVAYLDGQRPSLVMCRGYYTRCVLAAWNWRDSKLSPVWTFDSDDGTPGNDAYRGQGNHGIGVGDVDDDGRDEIVYGSCVIDDDGTGLYSTGHGHGDAMHFTDVDPAHPGLEVFKANGDGPNPAGIELRDARTGEQLFGVPSKLSGGMGRAVAFDVDPRYRGLEMWGYDTLDRPRWGWRRGWRRRPEGERSNTRPQINEERRDRPQATDRARPGATGLYDVAGNRITEAMPGPCNMAIWWDGDVLRELLDGVRVTKWDFEASRDIEVFDGEAYDCVSNNGSKSNPCLCADILGDWREEIVARSRDSRELRIFVTTIPAERRLTTLMHDPIYRLAVAWQNVSYNQPAHPGFYLGHDMAEQPHKNLTAAPLSAPTNRVE